MHRFAVIAALLLSTEHVAFGEDVASVRGSGRRVPPPLAAGAVARETWARGGAAEEGTFREDGTFRVVLDPGHGGTNLGARGTSGVYEKAATLDLAEQVREALARRLPGARVLLTRRDDRYLTLRSRALAANREGADALVSLHFNASRGRDQRGFETYAYGGETEPPAGLVPAPLPPIDAILTDLRRSVARTQSAYLAAVVQRHMAAARGPALDRGVRRAPFDVLRDAEMPAVLVEVGFLDHPEEGHEMVEPLVQERVAGAIARALAEFRGHLAARERMVRLARADR